jgi:hypothetical protein
MCDTDGRIFRNRPTRRLPRNGIRFVGTVGEFRGLLALQRRVLRGELGGPRDGSMALPPDR